MVILIALNAFEPVEVERNRGNRRRKVGERISRYLKQASNLK